MTFWKRYRAKWTGPYEKILLMLKFKFPSQGKDSNCPTLDSYIPFFESGMAHFKIHFQRRIIAMQKYSPFMRSAFCVLRLKYNRHLFIQLNAKWSQFSKKRQQTVRSQIDCCTNDNGKSKQNIYRSGQCITDKKRETIKMAYKPILNQHNVIEMNCIIQCWILVIVLFHFVSEFYLFIPIFRS